MSGKMNKSKLFEPLQIGHCRLSSRIVMGPMSRNKADEQHVQDASAPDYYAQRACVPGTLLITEGTFASPGAGGYAEVTGIWSPEQVAAWKAVVGAVHKNGSYIILQLWALGRTADPNVRREEGAGDVVSSSAVPEKENGTVPREMTEEEIWASINEHATAARNAIEGAGFDGVELHGGNGSLIDQFTQDVVNKRTDKWGGSVQNRSRFGIELAKAVANAVGPAITGFRLTPWSTFGGMGTKEAIPQFSNLIEGLKQLNISYIHLVESRISGKVDVTASEPLDDFVNVWPDHLPIIVAGGFTPETARQAVDETYPKRDVAIAFGRHFVANPDLVRRIQDGEDFE